MASVLQGQDKKQPDQYLNEKPFGKFLGPFLLPVSQDAICAHYRLSGASS